MEVKTLYARRRDQKEARGLVSERQVPTDASLAPVDLDTATFLLLFLLLLYYITQMHHPAFPFIFIHLSDIPHSYVSVFAPSKTYVFFDLYTLDWASMPS